MSDIQNQDCQRQTNDLKDLREYVFGILSNKELEIAEKNLYNLSIRQTKQKYELSKLTIKDDRLFDTYKELAFDFLSMVLNSNIQTEDVQSALESCTKELKEEQEEEDAFIINPIEATEGIHKCFKCGSTKAISYQLQTRSGDEGTTTFIQCANKVCGSKWKM